MSPERKTTAKPELTMTSDQFRDVGSLAAVADKLRSRQDAMIEQDLMTRYRSIKEEAMRQRQAGNSVEAFETVISGIVMGALPDSRAQSIIRRDLVVDGLITPEYMKKVDEITNRLAADRGRNAPDSKAHADYVESLIIEETEDYFDAREKAGDPNATAGKLLAYALGYSEGSINPQFRYLSSLPNKLNEFVTRS